MEKKRTLTKEERRQRQKQLEQARRQRRLKPAQESPPAEPATATDAAPSSEASSKKAGRPRKRDVTAADVSGLKYFQELKPRLEPLHKVGCERDKSNNRDLHYDDLCMLLLLAMFHPIVDGQRALQQASELEKVQQRLQVTAVGTAAIDPGDGAQTANWQWIGEVAIAHALRSRSVRAHTHRCDARWRRRT